MKAYLTKKERVLYAVKHKKADMLPVQFDFSGSAWDTLKKILKLDSVEAGWHYFDNHIIYAYFNDTLGAMRNTSGFSASILFDQFGVGFDTSKEGICVCRSPIEKIDDFLKYKFPDPNAPALLENVEYLVKKYADKCIVSTNHIMCLFERAWTLRGFENLMCDLYLEEEFVHELLEKVMEYQIVLAKRMVKAGVNCARTSDDYGSQTGMLISPEMWRKFIKPRIRKIWGVYKDAGLPVIHHSCGDVRPIIPDLIECGVDILNDLQSECMPAQKLADKYGKELCFYGGISAQKTLVYGTQEEVRAHVEDIIKILGNYHGYIISPGVTLTSDVPIENIFAMVETADEFRY